MVHGLLMIWIAVADLLLLLRYVVVCTVVFAIAVVFAVVFAVVIVIALLLII